MLIFGLDRESAFADALARQLGRTPTPHETRRFEDGECKLRPLVDPCGTDAYVVQSLHGEAGDSPHDKLCRLLMFIATLRDHGAARVTAVVPYLAYARKDRRTKPFDPLGSRFVAQMFEAVGTDGLITLEVHNIAAFENAFRRPALSLESRPAFDALVLEQVATGALAVASPDPGGIKRAQLWREELGQRLQRPIGFAMCDKRRTEGAVGGTDLVAGDVTGATVLLVDDLVVSGQTLRRAAAALRQAGATRVIACVAHALFSEAAATALAGDEIAGIWVSDSVPPRAGQEAWEALQAKIRVVSCVPLFADTIGRRHDNWVRRGVGG
jgi:ribose-phosphate pyrophosphokinase